MHKAILLVGLVTIELSAQTLTTIVTFNGINGAGPVGGLVLAADGNFYGMTGGGGSGYGTVYQLTPSRTLTTLYNFHANDGGFPTAGLIQSGDGSFYGTTGESLGRYGTVFKITSAGVLTTLYTFSSNGCYAPTTPLIQATDGSLYGATAYGGTGGCIFRIAPTGTMTVLHSFGMKDGGNPSGLVQGSDGSFYGITVVGGTNNAGTVFKITSAGSLTTLYNFSGSDGSEPAGALVAAADGNFYGTTSAGGSVGHGTVFKITSAGALSTIHSFSGSEGSGALGALLQAVDGNFYGTTQHGGLNQLGTIFRVTPSGTLTTIYDFVLSDGSQPAGQLIQGSDGNIYGTSPDGGEYGDGALFKLTLGGPVQPPTVTANPATSVTDSSATLVATVTADGADTQAWFTYGTDSSHAGAVSSLHQGVGASPSGVAFTLPLNRLSANTTYYFQGFASNSAGTSSSPIASFTTAGSPVYQIGGMVSFAGKGLDGVDVVLEGSQGQSGPTADSGYYFFEAGAGGNYTVTPVASGYTFVPPSVSFNNLNSDHAANFTAVASAPTPAPTALISFNGSNGATPTGLIQARDGDLYGSTSAGGANNQGTIFRLTPTGVLTTMHSFSGSDGMAPGGVPLQAADGSLYGMTTSGGTGGAGTVYQFTPTGGFTTLADFGSQSGPTPGVSLIQATDGNLYGTTTAGGPFGISAVFRMTPAGVLNTLYAFASVEGNGPDAGLLQGTDGNFYGTLYGAGLASQPGLVFKMTPFGTVTALYVFCAQANCADGETPAAALIQGADGNFYGTTAEGGNDGAGAIFRLTPTGVLTVLHSFSLADGASPGGLLLATDGNFYGTTSGAGASYGGTIFQLTPAGVFTTLHDFNTTDGASPQGPLFQAADGSLYGVTATGGAYGKGTVFRLGLPQVAPIVNPGSGVVSAASFQPGIAANSWITILGSNLSLQTDTWSNWIVNGVLPQSLDGVSVKVGSQLAYVAYISPGQINALAPDIPPGNAAVTVSNGIGASTPVIATAQTLQPAFFQWGQYAVATRTDYSDAVKNGTIPGVSTLPAKPGDTIILWGTGFGPTTPPLPQGVEVPSSTAYNTANPVQIMIGGTPAAVFGAALTSGAAGLYQVAIQIPASLSDGDYPVVASISGVQSPAGVLIAVLH